MFEITLGVQHMYGIEIKSVKTIGLRENANIRMNIYCDNI